MPGRPPSGPRSPARSRSPPGPVAQQGPQGAGGLWCDPGLGQQISPPQRQRARLEEIRRVANLLCQSVTGVGKRSPAAVRRVRSPGRVQSTREGPGQRADHCHSDPNSADLFPNGKVLSSPRRPCEGNGPAAFPLVSVLMVGATGFEPVTPSVSGGSGQLATPRAAPGCSVLPQLRGGIA
jgi:hypothetical protein